MMISNATDEKGHRDQRFEPDCNTIAAAPDLIAAAPDLLAACIEVAQGYSTRGSEMARAAVLKAFGSTQP